ncbi:DNA polymerase III subunit delta [Geomicrobium sp. JCM 19039]|uniref:DNA polymerase III subunit delta n=1 Tax=Geomicrobium sp. JCM 19039 TaxID=1460636 RepID=UPI00045F2B7F|nr:DNA polymerase III subunit delta [Geomicrobium sp. JCM 19039]GAK11444.1 DNA polymerase III delta subunit [Geomicrobium sp. JCM 19039]
MSTYVKAIEQIQKGNLQPLYLLYGTETYMIEDVIQTLTDRVLSPDEKEFNFSQYDLTETPVQAGIEDAKTASFFGNQKVIVLKHAYFLTGQKSKESIDHDLSQLERYVEEGLSDDILIITVESQKLDERKKIVKRLKKQATVIEAAPLEHSAQVEWLNKLASKWTVQFEPRALEHFLSITAPDLHIRKNEVEKCALFAGEGGVITESMVDQLVPKSLEDNVFTLIDRVSEGNTEKALVLYDELMNSGEEPIKITVLLARQLRMMSLVLDMDHRGYSQQKMAGTIGVPPFVVGKIRNKAKGLQSTAIYRALFDLAEVDYKMKQGLVEKDTALKLYIATLPGTLATK